MLITLNDSYIISTIAIGILTFLVVLFVRRVRRYPRGPFPLPLLGNLLLLRKSTQLYKDYFEWSKIYGDPFTLWIGNRPSIIVNDPINIAEANLGEKRNHFAGRPQTNMGKIILQYGDDIFFNNMDPTWNALRKVTICAVRKYAVGDHLPQIAASFTDAEIEHVILQNKPVSVKAFIAEIIHNVMAVTAFGFSFQRGDPDLAHFRKTIDDLQAQGANAGGLPSDLSPILGLILYRRERSMIKNIEDFLSFIQACYDKAKLTYVPGQVNHFTDAVQFARDEANAENQSIGQYLTEKNICGIITLLFNAGTAGSAVTLRWALLIIAKYPEIQEKLRDEIVAHLGIEGQASFSDRERLPHVSSFIMETLRMYPVLGVATLHETQVNTTLNDKSIPQGTSIMFNLWAQMHNEDINGWNDADVFKFDRFVVDGKFVARKQPEFATFGVGPRACPGEKLAHADMFLILVRIIQKSRIFPSDGNTDSIDLSPNPIITTGIDIIDQSILIQPIS